ncbi:glycosyltransferase family 2 protein [Paenisporosarcina cavernae]|uniref:glycosyltransferase family 2 protein n=1 Tax=Paenisporosarcina cavernae TaxID=2320858 RepID=UPI0013C4B479|nr:glycosyltransferase [Paenisporosarcina cavernae]
MSTALLFIFGCYMALQLMYLLTSLRDPRWHHNGFSEHTFIPKKERKISVLIPAYNEELVLEKCLHGWKNILYHNKEAIIISDGSTDNTVQILNDLLDLTLEAPSTESPAVFYGLKCCYRSRLYPEILVVDQVNAGKAAALNRGIALASGEIIVTLDADSILEQDSLLKVNQAFENRKVLALGGMVHVGQVIHAKGTSEYPTNNLLRYQLSGYLSSFYIRKRLQSSWNVIGVVSGAFGAFRKTVLQEIGGFVDTIGEDMEITFRLQHYIHNRNQNERLAFLPTAVCYTEVPEQFSSLFHQRIRWQKGFLDCLNRYKLCFFHKLSFRFSLFLLSESLLFSLVGVSAFLLLPYKLLTDTLTPGLIALLLLVALSEILIRVAGYIQALKLGFTFSKRSWVQIIFFTLVETVTYRLLDTFFFLIGTVLYFTGNRHKWNKLERSGSVVVKNDLQMHSLFPRK